MGAVTVEQYGGSSKHENRNIIRFSNSPTGYLPKENENTNLQSSRHPVFIAAVFTIAKTQKQPSGQQMDR